MFSEIPLLESLDLSEITVFLDLQLRKSLETLCSTDIQVNHMHWPLPGTAQPARDLAMLNGWKSLDFLASL